MDAKKLVAALVLAVAVCSRGLSADVPTVEELQQRVAALEARIVKLEKAVVLLQRGVAPDEAEPSDRLRDALKKEVTVPTSKGMTLHRTISSLLGQAGVSWHKGLSDLDGKDGEIIRGDGSTMPLGEALRRLLRPYDLTAKATADGKVYVCPSR